MKFSPLPVTSSLLGPNILINTLFSNTISLRSSLNVSDQVSRPYKTTGKIIFCLLFSFSYFISILFIFLYLFILYFCFFIPSLCLFLSVSLSLYLLLFPFLSFFLHLSLLLLFSLVFHFQLY
jgi:hypothetical protein